MVTRAILIGLVAVVLSAAACDPCYDDPDRCPTADERICTRLVDCGVIDGSEYRDCLRMQLGTEAPLDPVGCAACLEDTECDMLADCDEAACR